MVGERIIGRREQRSVSVCGYKSSVGIEGNCHLGTALA